MCLCGFCAYRRKGDGLVIKVQAWESGKVGSLCCSGTDSLHELSSLCTGFLFCTVGIIALAQLTGACEAEIIHAAQAP